MYNNFNLTRFESNVFQTVLEKMAPFGGWPNAFVDIQAGAYTNIQAALLEFSRLNAYNTLLIDHVLRSHRLQRPLPLGVAHQGQSSASSGRSKWNVFEWDIIRSARSKWIHRLPRM